MPVRNKLLSSLPAAAFERLRPYLERVTFKAHERLVKSGAHTEHVYFPEAGLVSLMLSLEDGAAIEVGLIGHEGLVGVLPALGASRVTSEAVVQIAGSGLRMRTEVLRREVGLERALRDALVRFLEALFIQVAQSVACNGHHTLRQRLARWLLMAADRGDTNEITLSHEFLAMMLGVRRPGVTIALGELKKAGIVRTGHGRVVIRDRKRLEAAACECYRTVKREYERLLP
jgi:CRP-like cAMP-binding protein